MKLPAALTRTPKTAIPQPMAELSTLTTRLRLVTLTPAPTLYTAQAERLWATSR